MTELINIGAKNHVLVNLINFPFFGYWKDLLYFFDTPIESEMVKMFTTQLLLDKNHLKHGISKISLAAKWAPSEGKEYDEKHNAVYKFCTQMRIKKAEYRKSYLTPLRQHLNIVETKLCNNDWDEVNYPHVPALAHLKYTKAFKKHDEDRYSQYMRDVADGKEKMNVKLIYPYQLVEKYFSGAQSKYPDDYTLNTMWNELVKQVREDLVKSGANLQALGVADCSGSMQGVQCKILLH